MQSSKERGRRSFRKGMTLVEIMIVLTILAGVMVAVGISAMNALEKAKIQTTVLKLQKVGSAVQGYYAFRSPNVFPDGIGDLLDPPGGESPYLAQEDSKDAWQAPIELVISGRHYEIRSPGPDGDSGSEDDIVLSSKQ